MLKLGEELEETWTPAVLVRVALHSQILGLSVMHVRTSKYS